MMDQLAADRAQQINQHRQGLPGDLGLHYLLAGEAYLRSEGHDHRLAEGDLAIVRQASPLSLAGSPTATTIDLDRIVATPGVQRDL